MGLYTPTIFLAALMLLTVLTTDIILRIIRYHTVTKQKYPLPPGPTPLPLLGSVLSINARLPWLTYTKWRKTYGDIIYVRLLDTNVIVLNSTRVATELLEKRSRIYSDRPFSPALVLYGNDCNFSMLRYSEHWRLCRRIFQQTFRANSVLKFRPMQLRRARELICNMINDPNEYQSHFHTYAAGVIMSTVYDYEPSPRNDPMVSIMDNYIRTALSGLAPGKVLLLKFFPFLLHTPDWLPGSWIKREAKEARVWRDKVVETPYQYVLNQMVCFDTAMVSDHIVRMEKFSGSYRSQYETALKHAAMTAFLGSVETTSSTLMTFTLAMVENPHVWRHAQASIDAVVGTGRLPEFDDRPSLPYVDAIVRETMRWRPVVPVMLHAVMCDDIYDRYYIPKGATILSNTWAMSRDETRYPDAEKFIPERFFDKEGKLTDDDPAEFIFGFGRRKCPGRYTADASVWSAIVTMLAMLNFNLAKDTDGNDITFKATFTNGVTDHPNYFPCQVTRRAHISKEMLDRMLRN